MEFAEEINRNVQGYEGPFDSELRHTAEVFLLLNELTISNEISIKMRSRLYIAMGYFIAPYDLYSEETFGAIGYVDDLILILTVLNEIKNELGIEPIYELWDGDLDELSSLLESGLKKISTAYPELREKVLKYLS